MFEITINGTVYKFKFGIGFVREVSGRNQTIFENGVKANIGLEYIIAMLQTEDVLTLVEVLDLANKYAGEPRITTDIIEAYLEDENTDIDKLFGDVLGFFEKSNATKKKALMMKESIEEAEKAQKEEEKTQQK